MSNSRRIAKNTLMLYFRQILIMAVSLYTVRVVLNILGAEDYCDEIFFDYLDHMKRIGASRELTDSFDRLITSESNTNPSNYLDTINEEVYNNCKKLVI